MLANKLRIGAASRGAAPRAVSRASTVRVQAVKNPVCEAYAKALIDLSDEKGKLEAVHTDMETMGALLASNAAFKELLGNPVVEPEQKRLVLNKLVKEGDFNEYTNNFLNLLNVKDRLGLLDQILESFELQYCTLTDTQVATLRSAVKLEQEQQFLIAKKLQELTGSKNIKLKPVIDEALIAGFVIEYGSSQIDLSIKGQIEKVAESINTDMLQKMA
eukprot:gene16904-23181_t